MPDTSPTDGQPDLTEVIDISQLPGWEMPEAKHGSDCGDPDCHDGFIMVNLSTREGFGKAVDVVMQWVMNAHFKARDASDDESDQIIEDCVDYLMTVDPRVVSGVVMGLSDVNAGMYLRLKEIDPDLEVSDV
jgi:hypothetical protein